MEPALLDDMGLGKTPKTLAWLLYLKQKEKPRTPTLLICPMSVVGNWEREYNGLPLHSVHGCIMGLTGVKAMIHIYKSPFAE